MYNMYICLTDKRLCTIHLGMSLEPFFFFSRAKPVRENMTLLMMINDADDDDDDDDVYTLHTRGQSTCED